MLLVKSLPRPSWLLWFSVQIIDNPRGKIPSFVSNPTILKSRNDNFKDTHMAHDAFVININDEPDFLTHIHQQRMYVIITINSHT